MALPRSSLCLGALVDISGSDPGLAIGTTKPSSQRPCLRRCPTSRKPRSWPSRLREPPSPPSTAPRVSCPARRCSGRQLSAARHKVAAALIADEDEPPTTELVEILNFVDLGILDLGILDAVDPSAYKRRFFAPCVLHVLTEDA